MREHVVDREVTAEQLRQVFGALPRPVGVVTGRSFSGGAGLTISSFTSVSLTPPLALFCPAVTSGHGRRRARGVRSP